MTIRQSPAGRDLAGPVGAPSHEGGCVALRPSTEAGRPLLLAPGIILQVHDLEASLAFYTQTLGLPLGLHTAGHAEVDAPGLVIELHEQRGGPAFAGPPAKAGASIGFRVDDLQQTVRYFEACGIPMSAAEDAACRWAQFIDPDGNLLRVVERK